MDGEDEAARQTVLAEGCGQGRITWNASENVSALVMSRAYQTASSAACPPSGSTSAMLCCLSTEHFFEPP